MAHRTKAFAVEAPALERAFTTQSTVEETICFGGRSPSGNIALQKAMLVGDVRSSCFRGADNYSQKILNIKMNKILMRLDEHSIDYD